MVDTLLSMCCQQSWENIFFCNPHLVVAGKSRITVRTKRLKMIVYNTINTCNVILIHFAQYFSYIKYRNLYKVALLFYNYWLEIVNNALTLHCVSFRRFRPEILFKRGISSQFGGVRCIFQPEEKYGRGPEAKFFTHPSYRIETFPRQDPRFNKKASSTGSQGWQGEE